MNTIKSLIIDDEAANGTVLKSMLGEHCPSVETIGYGSSVKEGYELICEMQPDLVFLDIHMVTQTGFDLLRQFSEPAFHVIFVTAFDNYALQAFEFNAIDYILKPVDHQRLINAVEKVKKHIRFGEHSNVVQFIRTLDEQTQLVKRIPFHQKNKVIIVELESIRYIQAYGSYCHVTTTTEERILSTKPLSDYEILLQPYGQFLRINKSAIINTHFIRSYTKGLECIISMHGTNAEFEVSRRKKTAVLHYLRENRPT